ncbi:MAG: LysR family transcriptional regulator substrate-binding protein [Elusimicrobiota bacterium]
MPPIIGDYHRLYPQVKIVLLNRKSEEITQSILDGEAEIGIGYLAKKNPEIISQKIGQAAFLLITEKEQQKKYSQSPATILKGPFIHFEEGVELRNYIERSLKLKEGLKIILELPSIEAILQYIKYGVGSSILPDFAVAEQWHKELFTRKLSNYLTPIVISAHTHRRRILTKAAEKFRETLLGVED